ncbi:AI-2E family transporter [Lunatibacter salilacus]|uniref:AI-2E family transporter n=1 Tax=Lunatibacter salilacus TaxID=2483804 RepID=UPI00131EA087|nr:AI-2E family transporter [Lunatibacter salilacus]
MENKLLRILLYFTLIVVSLTLFFWGIFTAKSFLAPLTVAALLTMVVLPVSKWLEKKSISRGLAAFFSTALILSFFVVIIGIVAWQVKNFTNEWPQIKERIDPKIEQLQAFVEDKTGISPQEQKETIFGPQQSQSVEESNNSESTTGESAQNHSSKEQEQSSATGLDGSTVKSIGEYAISFFSVFGNFILTFIYVFFFLLYRKKFTTSLMKMAPDNQQKKTKATISEIILISQNYLSGRLLLILFLAILYTTGLSISGIEQALLISVLAAVLSLMPYVGNMLGFGLAVAMAFVSGSGLNGVIGVSVTFGVAQFVESYILEPYVVGDKVNINPVFTIIVVVLGGAVWGVIGMLIAIPALGMLKVVFDRIPSLQPLGYLFGGEDIGDDQPGFFDKVIGWTKDKLTF